MLFEYAVDPDVMNSWDRLQLYLSNFGVRLGRLISQYPRDWEDRVLNNGTFTYPTTARVEVTLQKARDRLFSRYHGWDENRQWLENAEREHVARPFHAIIASSNPRSHQEVIVDGFDLASPPPLWRVLPAKKVARKASDLANAARILLQMSQTVVFIDRNFDPKKRGYRDALKEFSIAMMNHQKKWRASRIDYYCGDKQWSVNEFRRLCSAFLPSLLPNGMEIRLIRWRYAQMHNRFILTDRGGIQFGHGLDAAGPTEPQDDNLTLLDADYANELLQEFDGPTPKYTRDNACGALAIVGTNARLLR